MNNDVVNQMLMYMRPTIGPSQNISVTSTSSNTEIELAGRYLIQNLGPHPAYIVMSHLGTRAVTLATGMPLYPAGSGDMSVIPIQVGPKDVKNVTGGLGGGHGPSMRYLVAICDALQTATLKVTRVTLD